jgi:hypothetical protein
MKTRRNTVIQIGDKPGWQKPVINLIYKGEVFSFRITRKMAKQLQNLGMATEG